MAGTANRRIQWGRTAAAGVAVVGVVGLGLIAVPAGAGAAPQLPPVSAEDLVTSVLAADQTAFNGTVELDNELGLPALPGVPQAADGTTTARVWTDGAHAGRVQLPTSSGERTLVTDGTQFWSWNSEDRTVQHGTKNPAEPGTAPREEADADPAAAATKALEMLRPTSQIAVDGTAEVAGRPAYELVLSPNPSERTLLREVRIAVDAEHRMPLRLTVLAAGSQNPVLQAGFSDITFGAQDPATFTFTPPPGATVQEATPPAATDREHDATPKQLADAARPKIVGDGWDTVVVATLPKPTAQGGSEQGRDEQGRPANGGLPAELAQLGKRVTGPWGSGTLVSTAVATAIVTDDGRIAAGAVPEQVLTEALAG